MRSLLLEESDRVRKGLTRLLATEGHEVLAFDSAESAESQLDDLHPDAAVLDVRLPAATATRSAATSSLAARPRRSS